MSKNTGKVFDATLVKRVLSYTKPYKRIFYWTIFLTVFVALISPIRPRLIQFTIDNYVMVGNLSGLAKMILLLIGLLIIETVTQFYQTYYSSWIGQAVLRDIRTQLYQHISYFKLKYFDNTPIGTLVTRVVNDIETIGDIFSEGLLSIIGDLLKMICVLAVMLYIDWSLTLICIIPMPILIFATNVFKNGIRKTFQEVRNEVSNLNTFTQEHITGVSVIQAFNREEAEYQKFKEINARHQKANIRSILYYSIFFPVVEILSALSIGLLVWWATKSMVQNPLEKASPGTIIEFVLYINMLYRPMRQLADRFNTLQMGIVSSERVFKLIDMQESIPDNGTYTAENMKGEVSFQNVSFAYIDQNYVLHNLSLDIQAGQKLAIVGATGSGKSTMINLLSRLYEINKGKILIDGIDIRDYKIAELHKNIGVVLQDVFLFSDTIMNNIRLSNPDISEEKVIEAAKKVGAHDFIMQLPGGYNYNVRERGAMLSVGQRQLISFIRAYVYNPKILVLDEATSSVDSHSEVLIQQATEIITKDRTSIIIAHRLSTIRKADKIIVLDKGIIIEQGSHEELLLQNGHYRKLNDLQFGNEQNI